MTDQTLAEAVCLLNSARAPLREAWHGGGSVADVDLGPVKAALERAYGTLTGGGAESLNADTTASAQRLRVALLVHLGAEQLSDYVRSAISEGLSEEHLHGMLRKSRNLVQLLEKHILGGLKPQGNVTMISKAQSVKDAC